jgi:iron(III) transport system ATP-binding protein
MLETHDLTVRYADDTAVDKLNLSLSEREIVTLVGPTGCGKTSVLRAIAGLVAPAAGRIRIGSQWIDRNRLVPPEKRGTGLVFQDFALFPHMSVEENVAFRVRDRARVASWLAALGLESHRHAQPETLSGGQKQRVALARALAHQPALVLLDEPLSNLDASLKDELRWTIRDALKTAGVPALWVTHDQTEALSVGDRLGVMRDGRLEQLADPERCFAEPATRFVADFLGEASFLPGHQDGQRVETAAGIAQAATPAPPSGTVDVMVRPDDLVLTSDATGHGRITGIRYEGETHLYTVRLGDGTALRVRMNHESRLERGESVTARITAAHPLAIFEHTPGTDDAEPPSPALAG